MHRFEVEIKSLLGSKEKADTLVSRMKEADPSVECHSKNVQLNHYFVGGTLGQLVAAVANHLTAEGKKKLEDLASRAQEFSVRTRKKDDTVLLVVKASVGDDTSANGVSRIEFEETVSLSLEELDQKVLSAGFSYQAKWSREREEYQFKGATVCLDRNAGYGYVAEFEKVVDDENAVSSTKEELLALMRELGVSELPQERLERMFAHYNAHWPEYYGTDNIFNIE